MSARWMRRGSNRSGLSNDGRIAHRDLGAEAAIAEVRPVADLAVADAHDVGEPVADHVGEEDRLGRSAKTSLGPFSSSQLLGARRRRETLLGQRLIPGENRVLGDQDVGKTVACDVDETEVRVSRVDVRRGSEGVKSLPAAVRGPSHGSRPSGHHTGRGRDGHRRRGRATAAARRSVRHEAWRDPLDRPNVPLPRLRL